MSSDLDQKTIDLLNRICRDIGLFPPQKRRTAYFYWRVPKDWKGTKFLFGYTPHKVRHEGKLGFFTLKLRVLKNGQIKISKAVRFAKRKIATQRSIEWFKKHYGEEPK